MGESVAITGLGMVSPAGLTARQSCAALRAGITRFEELSAVVDRRGSPVKAACIPRDAGATANACFSAALVRACHEALATVRSYDPVPERLHLSILGPEAHRRGTLPTFEDAARSIVSRLALPNSTSVSRVDSGNAAGIDALAAASRRLASDATAIELIVGFDSLVEMAALSYLDARDRLKGPGRSRGLIPGEAVACLVVQNTRSARALRLPIYAIVEGIGCADEPFPANQHEPCLADGLTSAIAASLGSAGWDPGEIGSVYTDLNGEVYRAHEWALASCRMSVTAAVVHPADCIGDVGASAAPLLMAMAATALARGYAPAARALVCCASDSGRRGTVCLRAAGSV